MVVPPGEGLSPLGGSATQGDEFKQARVAAVRGAILEDELGALHGDDPAFGTDERHQAARGMLVERQFAVIFAPDIAQGQVAMMVKHQVAFGSVHQVNGHLGMPSDRGAGAYFFVTAKALVHNVHRIVPSVGGGWLVWRYSYPMWRFSTI